MRCTRRPRPTTAPRTRAGTKSSTAPCPPAWTPSTWRSSTRCGGRPGRALLRRCGAGGGGPPRPVHTLPGGCAGPDPREGGSLGGAGEVLSAGSPRAAARLLHGRPHRLDAHHHLRGPAAGRGGGQVALPQRAAGRRQGGHDQPGHVLLGECARAPGGGPAGVPGLAPHEPQTAGTVAPAGEVEPSARVARGVVARSREQPPCPIRPCLAVGGRLSCGVMAHLLRELPLRPGGPFCATAGVRVLPSPRDVLVSWPGGGPRMRAPVTAGWSVLCCSQCRPPW